MPSRNPPRGPMARPAFGGNVLAPPVQGQANGYDPDFYEEGSVSPGVQAPLANPGEGAQAPLGYQAPAPQANSELPPGWLPPFNAPRQQTSVVPNYASVIARLMGRNAGGR